MNCKSMFLRKVNNDDLLLLYWWANDRDVRANAFNQNLISPADHKIWFEKRVNNPCVDMRIFIVDNIPVGQIRLEKARDNENDECVIDYSIDRQSRGKGLGKAILKLVETEVPKGTVLVGCVKQGNIASRKAFEANFYGKTYITNQNYIKYRKVVR